MEEARFMGRMTASVSHDLCNVLATIQQAAGLLSDYLALARKESLKSMGIRPKFKYDQKFQEIIAQIEAQVDRGQDICGYLSGLAHAPDENVCGCDMGQAARLLGKLSIRLLKKYKVGLTVQDGPGGCSSCVSLIEVLTRMDTALEAVAKARGGGGEIVLAPGDDGLGRVHVDILCEGLGDGDAADLARRLNEDNAGLYKAEAVQGGVRLAFEKAGREA